MSTPLRLRLRTRWQIALRYCGLTPTVRAVGWALSTWMRPDGDSCRPSADDIAAASGTSRATAFRALATLKRRGLLRIHGGGGRHRASTYEPLIPAELEAWIEAVLSPANGRTGETVSGVSGAKGSQGITQTVAAGNGRTGETVSGVSGAKGSQGITQTVAPGAGNGRTGETLAFRAYGAGSEEEEPDNPLPADIEAVARSGQPATALRMLRERRRQEAEAAG